MEPDRCCWKDGDASTSSLTLRDESCEVKRTIILPLLYKVIEQLLITVLVEYLIVNDDANRPLATELVLRGLILLTLQTIPNTLTALQRP